MNELSFSVYTGSYLGPGPLGWVRKKKKKLVPKISLPINMFGNYIIIVCITHAQSQVPSPKGPIILYHVEIANYKLQARGCYQYKNK